jgi:hypothetical protein
VPAEAGRPPEVAGVEGVTRPLASPPGECRRQALSGQCQKVSITRHGSRKKKSRSEVTAGRECICNPRPLPLGVRQSLEQLCGRPHNRSNVAKLVMWRRPEQSPIPSNAAPVERHISYRVIEPEGSPSIQRLVSTACRSSCHRPRSSPTPSLSSPDRLPHTRSSSPATHAPAMPGSC